MTCAGHLRRKRVAIPVLRGDGAPALYLLMIKYIREAASCQRKFFNRSVCNLRTSTSRVLPLLALSDQGPIEAIDPASDSARMVLQGMPIGCKRPAAGAHAVAKFGPACTPTLLRISAGAAWHVKAARLCGRNQSLANRDTTPYQRLVWSICERPGVYPTPLLVLPWVQQLTFPPLITAATDVAPAVTVRCLGGWSLWQNFYLVLAMLACRLFSQPHFHNTAEYTRSQYNSICALYNRAYQ